MLLQYQCTVVQIRENVEAGVRVVRREMAALVCFSLFLAFFPAYVIHKFYYQF